MEKPIGVKIKDIELTNVRITMDVLTAFGTDVFDDDNDNEHMDIVKGKITYFDPELFDEEGIDDQEIGSFTCKILYGDEQKIYNALENSSLCDSQYAQELFDVRYHNDGRISYSVREEYYELMSEVYENRFMIFDRVEIDEMYRGNKILGRVIHTIRRTFNMQIFTKPYPLQHEGNENPLTFKHDLRKVVNSYKRIGFKRGRKRSEYFILW
jgi:hypothetical protein